MTDPLSVLPSPDDLPTESVPDWVDPMLATLVHDHFSDPDWVFERKLDGERALAYRAGGDVRLLSRNQQSLSDTYPEIAEALAATSSTDFVVDGEVVAFDGRVTSFSRLQQRMQIRDREAARSSPVAVYYYIFDVLHVDGRSTRGLPQRRRKEVLKALFDYRDPLRFTAHRNERGEELFADACRRGWEGLIAKDARAPYESRRSKKWLKFKCSAGQELVVGGYTEPHGERTGFGSLLLGYYEGDRFIYAGKVGTGFDTDMLADLAERLQSMQRDESPFDTDAPADGVTWVEPRLVAEIGFTEWTSAGRLRHPRFLGLRDDKEPEQVVREVPQ